MKYAFPLLLVVLVLGVAWFFLKPEEASAPVEENTGSVDAAGGGIAPAIAWQFEDAGEENGIPQTRVKAFIDGNTYELGVSQGSCAEIAAEDLQENQVSGALCWYAGAGDEYGIFLENERYVVRKGVQEESTAESQGFRGDFETILSL